MNDYTQRGFNKNLKKGEDEQVKQFTSQEVDFVIPPDGVSADKIKEFKKERFYFVPDTAPLIPKEGFVYYDKTLKKLKLWTGSAWEVITSV